MAAPLLVSCLPATAPGPTQQGEAGNMALVMPGLGELVMALGGRARLPGAGGGVSSQEPPIPP